TAPKGKTGIGSQPIIGEQRNPSLDSTAFVSLSGKQVTLLQKGESHRRWEAGLNWWYERSCAPVPCGKNDQGSGAGCTRRSHNSPMKCASTMGNSSLR